MSANSHKAVKSCGYSKLLAAHTALIFFLIACLKITASSFMDTVYAVPIAFIFTVVHSNSCRCHSVSYANDYPLSPVKFFSPEKASVKISQLYRLTRIQPAASLRVIPRFIGGICSGLIA